MVQQIYQMVQQTGQLRVFPPRYTLREPTRSGAAHQFDIVLRHNQLTTAIECKFRKKTGIDELFGYKGKLTDYKRPPRAIFVTTSEIIPDDVFCYAIAHEISVVCFLLPPVGYMLQQVRLDTDLARRIGNLQTRMKGDNTPGHVLVEWQNAFRRFAAEGYS